MAYIEWICEIFSEPQGPYTVLAISKRMQRWYGPDYSEQVIRRALRALEENPSTAGEVQPLDPDEKPRRYGFEAARRIARKAARSREPDWKIEAWKNYEARMKVTR